MTVIFNTYHLDTGNSCDAPSACTRQAFKHWADREASPAEIASLQGRELEALLHSPYPTNREALTGKTAIDNFRVAPPRLTGADRTQIFA